MDAHVYEYNFSYTSNSYKSSYDSRVMSFYPLSDPITSYEFYIIGSNNGGPSKSSVTKAKIDAKRVKPTTSRAETITDKTKPNG